MEMLFDKIRSTLQDFFASEEDVIERDISKILTTVLADQGLLSAFVDALGEDEKEPSDIAKSIGGVLMAFGAVREDIKETLPERLHGKLIYEINAVGTVLISAVYNMGARGE